MSCWRTSSLRLGALLCALVTTVSADDEYKSRPESRLRWSNGDELAGRIIKASPERLVWQSSALSRAVSLDLSVLDSIQMFGAEKKINPPRALRVVLTGGSVLFGELKQITPTHVVINSRRHGEVTIDRAWIESLSRSSDAGEIDLVGGQGDGWKSVDPRWVSKKTVTENWTIGEPGQVATTTAGARLYNRTKLPDYCDIELSLHSTGRPAFSVALGSIMMLQKRTGNLEIETWGDALVVKTQSTKKQVAFEHLIDLDDETKSVNLRIFWDRKQGKLAVFGGGRALVETDVAPATTISTGGVLVENKGADLTITRLRVNTWSGDQSPKVVSGQSRLRTTAGREFYGQISGPNDDGELTVTSVEGDTERIETTQVGEIVLQRSEARSTMTPNCALVFNDGGRLNGQLHAIDKGRASLMTGFSKTPVTAPLDQLTRCQFFSTKKHPDIDSQHVLEFEGLALRGTLASAGNTLGWRLVGAAEVIPLVQDRSLLIRRADVENEGDGEGSSTDENGDILVLNSGEQIPCRVETVDEHFVTLSTDFSAAARIPQQDVQAIAFGAERPLEVVGFKDPKWKFTGKQPDQLEVEDDRLVFHDQATVFHPELLTGGTLEFDVDWNRQTQSYLMVTITGEQARNPQQGIVFGGNQRMFYLMFYQQQLMVHVMQGNAFRQLNMRKPIKPKGPLRLRLQVIDNEVVLHAGDDEIGKMSLPRDRQGPLGVTMQTQAIRNQNGAQGGDLNLRITKLRAGRATGLFQHLAIAKSARTHVLTVPRMRRNRPPAHLLVGKNGDLLRGKLLAMGPSSVQFQSRLDDVIIPRDRLSGVIWLPKETEAAPNRHAHTPGEVRATFRNGVVLHFTPDRIEKGRIIATHSILGDCRLSLDAINELRMGDPAAEEANEVVSFTEWTLISAKEPVIPDPSGGGFGTHSELVGTVAEDFTLKQLDGKPFKLSDHRGKVVVLDFWATWCGPCVTAMPELIAATGGFPPEDVLFIAVNQDEANATIQKFLDARGWADVTVVLDKNGVVAQKYQVEGIPQTVVIDKDGKIAHVHLGASPNLQEDLTKVIEELLTGED